MTKAFCFLDLETTGLDPINDYVLEIAWQFTDEDFKPLHDGRSYVIDHGHYWGSVFHALRNAAPVVREMHAKSLLAVDLLGQDAAEPGLILQTFISDLDDAQGEENRTIHLAGDSVWFDRDFLQYGHLSAQFADLFANDIHHRVLDLSSLKVFLESQGIDPAIPKGNHRALNDVYASIDGARSLALGLKRGFSVSDDEPVFDNAGRHVSDFLFRDPEERES